MNEVLWRQLKKNILYFSKRKTKPFEEPFQKLIKGLKLYYPPADPKQVLEASGTETEHQPPRGHG